MVILGRPSLAESEDQVAAAARILADLPNVAFLPVLRRGNVNGALDLGLAPGVLPGRVSLDDGPGLVRASLAGDAAPGPRAWARPACWRRRRRGHMGALVLVGADPLRDFPDSTLAVKGLLGARFVVAVDTHMTDSVRRADVILPAAAWSERRGTFTNIEGRITWLSQLVTDHGVAWPDWMIASELAARLGADLGFTSLEDIWDEVVTVSPLHGGAGYELISEQRARDGVLVPVGRDEHGSRSPRPLDPMADPGIASAELHKLSPTALLVSTVAMVPEPDERHCVTIAVPAGHDGPEPPASSGVRRCRAPMPPVLGLPAVPPPAGAGAGGSRDGYLRLVSRRTLWDGGTQVQSVPALASLHPEPGAAGPSERPGRHGRRPTAKRCRSTSGNGALTLPAARGPGLPAGTALLPWNLPGAHASDLIDASAPVTEVRVESTATEAVARMGDPLFVNGLNLAVWIILLVKVVVDIRHRAGVGAVHGHVRAQGGGLARRALRTEPGRPQRLAAVTGRRHQAAVQGSIHAPRCRQADLPASLPT